MELTEVFGSGNLCVLYGVYPSNDLLFPHISFLFFSSLFFLAFAFAFVAKFTVVFPYLELLHRLNFRFHALFTLFEDYQASAISTSPKVCRPCSSTSMDS